VNITIPTSQVDLFDNATLQNPYPAYAELRELGPAVWMEVHQAWAIPRYTEVRSVLRDHETFSSAPNPGLEPEQPYMPRGDILGSDPPVHEQLRSVLSDQLGPRALRELRDEIAAQADQLVAEVVEQREFDVVSVLARRFPVDVVSHLVGLETGGVEFRENLFTFADAAFNTFGPLNARTQASLETVMSMLEFMQTAIR
jgi:cytochrome P450